MNIKLDKKDRKLLVALDFHSRDTYAALAKRIGTSKQTVDYKLRRLERLGVIKNYYTVINMPKLGYQYCRLLVTLQGTTNDSMTEIVSFLKRKNEVFWLYGMQGQYDLLIDIWVRSVEEFRVFIEECMSNFGKFMRHKSENIVTNVKHFQNRYITMQEATEVFDYKVSGQIIKVDETDKKILSLLSQNARSTLVELSAKLGISAVAVANRIRNLEQQKIILGYRPNMDHTSLGYGWYKIFLNLSNPSSENIKKVEGYLKLNPLVLYIVEGVGFPADMDFEIVAESPLQLDKFIRGLREAFPEIIANYTPLLFADIFKVRHAPF